MKLSKRLETIIKMAASVTEGRCIADVGTDHGFVPIRLIEDKAASHAIAMDVRKGPLERAKEHICLQGLDGQIETRLSDGLEMLQPGEADTVVIAGMGGELMLRILTDGKHVWDGENPPKFVLSPQSELEIFRRGLEELGFKITEETMLEEDGKYYVVMVVERGNMHYQKAYEYKYGKYLLDQKNPVLRDFLKRQETQLKEILVGLSTQDTPGAKARQEQLKEELKDTKEAYDAVL